MNPHESRPHNLSKHCSWHWDVPFCSFAYFLERKTRPKLTFALFLEIFVLSILGVSLTLNMYFASLSTPLQLSLQHLSTLASLTFIIAVVLRLEVVNLRNPRGIAKVLGTFVSLENPPFMKIVEGLNSHCCKLHNLVLKAFTLKRYPAPLSLTAWMSFVGAAQSAIFTAIMEHKPAAWTMGFNIDFWATVYAGVVCSSVVIFIQLWCMEKKGPVFVTMFNPLSTILVAVLAYFVLGEKLYTGSILGGVIVIVGLYLLLWGKDRDQEARIGIGAILLGL
ncbi:hypothetical protein CRYUN_Cryun40dG0032100 [Craigia yunnanensis]